MDGVCTLAELLELDEEIWYQEQKKSQLGSKRKRSKEKVPLLLAAELEEELDDLLPQVVEYHHSRNWFSSNVVFLAPPIHSINPDSQEIARLMLRRLALEAGMLGATEADVLDERVTHVVTYHRPQQALRPDSVIHGLGGNHEQDLVNYGHLWHPQQKQIQVVYQD